jgi:hypothetical protein
VYVISFGLTLWYILSSVKVIPVSAKVKCELLLQLFVWLIIKKSSCHANYISDCHLYILVLGERC